MTAGNDRLLLDGDQQLSEPPSRRVPRGGSATIEYTAVFPADRLRHDRLRAAEEGLADRFSTLLRQPDRSWADFVEQIIGALHADGHVVWLSGGAARDVVATGNPAAVNDLDMAGTAPAGQFTAIAYRHLALVGKTNLRQRVSSDLICSISDGGEAIIEYKGLHQDAFRFPATGGDLERDAASRDFTINALLYDPMRDQLLDPCGSGMADLAAVPRRLVPLCAHPEPLKAAALVLRAVKFLCRWRTEGLQVDDTSVRDLVAGLASDCWAGVDDAAWRKLRRMCEKVSAEVPAAEARTIAKDLGDAALDLLDRMEWSDDDA